MTYTASICLQDIPAVGKKFFLPFKDMSAPASIESGSVEALKDL
jgi:hypothetical protein